MAEVLTRAEMEAKYDGEWVLIGEPQRDRQMRVVGGKVLLHDKDRDEFDRRYLALDPYPKSSAVLYFGRIPEHILLLIVP